MSHFDVMRTANPLNFQQEHSCTT